MLIVIVIGMQSFKFLYIYIYKECTMKRLLLENNNDAKSICYSDANWVGSLSDRRSTFRYCILIDGNMISWRARNKIQLPYLVLKINIMLCQQPQRSLHDLKIYSQSLGRKIFRPQNSYVTIKRYSTLHLIQFSMNRPITEK